MKQEIILVNEKDEEIGIGEKIKVHKKGKLHRAFSIFVFNFKGELLLQQRAKEKYHSGGLWSNTCCSHPRPNEILKDAIHRRLKEEMGFDCELKEVFNFIYQEKLDNELIEHEFLHVFIGKFDGKVVLNKNEAMDYKWISVDELKQDINKNSERYTCWFKIAFEKYLEIHKKPKHFYTRQIIKYHGKF